MSSGLDSTDFTEAEIRWLDEAVAEALEGFGKASFRQLVEKYRLFVASLDGYPFSIYDYDNDVSVRETIDQVLEHSSIECRTKALSILAELDEAFLDRTVEVHRPPRGQDSARVFPWYARLPKRPGKELADDIESGAT